MKSRASLRDIIWDTLTFYLLLDSPKSEHFTPLTSSPFAFAIPMTRRIQFCFPILKQCRELKELDTSVASEPHSSTARLIIPSREQGPATIAGQLGKEQMMNVTSTSDNYVAARAPHSQHSLILFAQKQTARATPSFLFFSTLGMNSRTPTKGAPIERNYVQSAKKPQISVHFYLFPQRKKDMLSI